MSDKVYAITLLHLSLDDFERLMPFEFSNCVGAYSDNKRNILNDENMCIYNAIIQSKSKGRYKQFIKANKEAKTTKASISERKEVMEFFGIGGDTVDKSGNN